MVSASVVCRDSKSLPETIVAGQKKTEQTAEAITLAQAEEKAAKLKVETRNSQLGQAQKNILTATTALENANKQLAAAKTAVAVLKKNEKEARTKLEQASATHDEAMSQVTKWKAAQVNVLRLEEELNLQKLNTELEDYTTATAEAKAQLTQAQAALVQAQQQLDNIPIQTKVTTEKLQNQLSSLDRENEKLDALGQLLTDRKTFCSKMETTAKESAKVAATEPDNSDLAKAVSLLKETIAILKKDIDSVQTRHTAQNKSTETAKTAVAATQKKLDQIKLLPEKLKIDIQSKTAIVQSTTEKLQKISNTEKTFTEKVASQKAKTDRTSEHYFALLSKHGRKTAEELKAAGN